MHSLILSHMGQMYSRVFLGRTQLIISLLDFRTNIHRMPMAAVGISVPAMYYFV